MSLQGYNFYNYPNGFKNNEFHHVVLSISGTSHSLYLDGSMVAQNSNAGNIFATYVSTIPNFYIGCATDLSYGLTGYIDNFKIWNRALLATDISSIYYNDK
jgi:hypothetical protein